MLRSFVTIFIIQLSIIVLITLVEPPISSAQYSDSNSFVQDYSKRLEQIKPYYSHIYMSGDLSKRVLRGETMQSFVRREDYRSDDELELNKCQLAQDGMNRIIRVDCIKSFDKNRLSKTSIIGSNLEYSFDLYYNTGSRPLIRAIGGISDFDNHFVNNLYPYLSSSYQIGYIDADKLIHDPSFFIDSIERMKYRNVDCLCVQFHCRSPKIMYESGLFYIAIKNNWVVLRSICDIPIKRMNKVWKGGFDSEVFYNLDTDGFPDITEVDDILYSRHSILKIDRFTRSAPSDIGFRLSSFGLPEIGQKAESIQRYRALASFFIIGAGLIFTGFIVFFLARKVSRSRNNA